jgi:hypothetical protein
MEAEQVNTLSVVHVDSERFQRMALLGFTLVQLGKDDADPGLCQGSNCHTVAFPFLT